MFRVGIAPYVFINIFLLIVSCTGYFCTKFFSYILAALSWVVLYPISIYIYRADPLNAAFSILVFNCLQTAFIKYKDLLERTKQVWSSRIAKEEERNRIFSEEDTRLIASESEIINKELAVVKLYEITKKMSEGLKFSTIFETFSLFLKENFKSFRGSELVILKDIGGRSQLDRTYKVCGPKEKATCESSIDYEALMSLLTENKEAAYLTREKDELSFVRLRLNKDVSAFFAIPLLSERRMIGVLTIENLPFEDIENFAILAAQFALEIKKALLYETVEELAITDGLTGLYVRRYFFERLEEELKRSRKHKFKFAFLMIDMDDFKKCNDTYGHLVGDSILKNVGRIIKENSREIDLTARYGGEEFSIVLPDTGKEASRIAAERIRHKVEESIFRAYDEKLKITISIGISIYPDDSEDIEELVSAADKALYSAKHFGKNIVSVYER